MNYARAIRIVRAAKGLSQKDLAKRAKIDASYVSLLEAGDRAPSVRTVQKIASALKVPMPVITLLASQKGELRGINQEQAAVLGQYLLDILANAEPA